jgi:hypothetical protein
MADESMKRRVGKALQDKWNAMQDLPPIELTDEEMDELGAAAIEAMREPTATQLAAAQTAWLDDPLRKSSTIYRAMIDAALNSSTTVPNKDQA